MKRSNIRPSGVPSVLPVGLGGTSSATPQAARTALGMVSAASLGQKNGLAVLDQNTKLDATIFENILPRSDSVSGPSVIYTGQTVQFEITDYDSFQTYDVQASVGSASISGSTITYIAPAVAQPGGFTLIGVDNRIISFDILPVSPDQPMITTPVNNSTGVGDSLQATATAFSIVGGVSTHQSSDWQIATDAAFTNIINQSIDDTVNKTSWTVSNPSTSTTYYLRCRYKSTSGGYSQWSSAVSYMTRASFFPVTEEAVIMKSRTITAECSITGNILAVGHTRIPASGTNYGGFRVYSKNTGSWVEEFSFQSTFPNDYSGKDLRVYQDGTKILTVRVNSSVLDSTGFGVAEILSFSKATGSWVADPVFQTDRNYYPASMRDIGVSDDHTRLVYCGVKPNAGGGNMVVVARVYVRSGNTWVGEANLEVSVGMTTARAFTCLMSGDGTTIVITAEQADGASHNVIHTFKRSGSTWTKLADYISDDVGFGNDAALNTNGTVLAVSAKATVSNGGGEIRVFKLVSDVWTQEGVITNPVNTTTGNFGFSLAFNSDTSKFMVSDPDAPVNGFATAGVIYRFSYVAGNVQYLGSFNLVSPYSGASFGQVIRATKNFSRMTSTVTTRAFIYG